MESHRVELYMYDLSRGLAAQYSPLLLGKRIDGVWHTSIVAYNREYFFGSRGVESCNPGQTILGAPKEVIVLGESQVPYSVFIEYLGGLSGTSYTGQSYDLLKNNCNNFTEELAQFLCGVSIPKDILDLPNEVLNVNPLILALIAQVERSAAPISEEQQRFSRESSPDLTKQIEEARSEPNEGSGVDEKKEDN